MNISKIYIGSDHAGYGLKTVLVDYMENIDILCEDLGPYNDNMVDYPDFGFKVAELVSKDPTSLGVLICGTGLGMSIVANKVKGIRAALCSEPLSAKLSREHNNANILCIGSRLIGTLMAIEILNVFLNTEFTGDRHEKRLKKIIKYEGENYKNEHE
jgi:ribose 5-phosphate isomerase B